MASGMKTIIFPVADLAKAKALFGALLETAPYADAPYYVGYRVGDLEIGLDPNGHSQGLTGPVNYWNVDDIKSSLQSLLDAGAEMQLEIKDVGGGNLIARVKDADGNVIGLKQEP
jgi:predicted enzyme related to lactoylglutathione lyase